MSENTELKNEKAEFATIFELEKSIAKDLLPKTVDFFELLGWTFDLSNLTLSRAYPVTGELSLDKQVCSKLLMRLSNDLRSCMMLARCGYDEQANSLAGSVYECAFTIAVIANEKEKAEKWVNHSDPRNSFMPAWNLTEAGMKAFNGNVQLAEELYKTYSQMCWGKHLNPIAQQQGGIEPTDLGLDFYPGPRADELTERGIAFCCTKLAQFGGIGIEMFRRYYVLPQHQNEIIEGQKKVNDRFLELNKRCLERWSSEEPYPDGWRSSLKTTKKSD